MHQKKLKIIKGGKQMTRKIKKKLLISIPIALLIIVLAQAAIFFITRQWNQKSENTRIISVITDSKKNFNASLLNKGRTAVTVLLENYRDGDFDGINADHGISLLVERDGKSYIFDLGESDITISNAEALGINILKADSVFISHGHIDHGGALPTFLKRNLTAPVYLSIHAPENHYRLIFGLYKVNTSLTKNAPDLFTRYQNRFRFISSDSMLTKNIYAVTGISGNYKKPSANSGVVKEDSNGNITDDDFSHEIAYVIKDADGLIVYSGCNHNGLLNTLQTVTERFPDTHIKAVLGGFHLMNPLTCKMEESEDEVRKLGEELNIKYPSTRVYTGHCTGVKGYLILKSILGNRIEYFTTGSRFIIN
jgi:7,8-dihydropterin-6-yl-methyl-4-(beta-D-ribofuranosyl)aminobenzene 5'-phosphate synthase